MLDTGDLQPRSGDKAVEIIVGMKEKGNTHAPRRETKTQHKRTSCHLVMSACICMGDVDKMARLLCEDMMTGSMATTEVMVTPNDQTFGLLIMAYGNLGR